MIKTIDVFRQKLHFRAPFQIAYEKVYEADVVIVKVVTEDGLVGLGNAAPDSEVTGETLEAVLSILHTVLTPAFFDMPLDSWFSYHKKIQSAFAGFPSAQSAAEEVILNLFSQQDKIPLSKFFGGYRTECPIMMTIGIKDQAAMLEEITTRLAEGYTTLKLKVGLDVEQDILRVKAARAVIPKTCRLTLDANQGYRFHEAVKLLRELEKTPIDLIEQPTDAKDLNALKELHQLFSIPVIADESVVSVENAYELLTGDYVSGVNIKLMKCGGPINFLEIFSLAKRLNKIIMIGCNYESHISMTMGADLALGLPLDYVDLDSGHLDFKDDPVTGGARIERGVISVDGWPVLN